MKKYLLISLALLLCACICTGAVLAHSQEGELAVVAQTEAPAPGSPEAPQATEPAPPVSKPEYVFPNDWSRTALEFAVEKGILKGDAKHDLRPHDSITRAETAAVLVRLLGAKGTGSLENFKDADPKAWYYPELSAAVAAGIFNGTGANTIEPNEPITREQVLVVLCRAFGVVSKDPSAYEAFSDSKEISSYARASVGAMREKGLLRGYPDGSLKPQAPISRAETAQLLYNLFDVIADSPEQIPAKGRVLYRGSEPLPEELYLDGSLILAYNTPGDQHMGLWQINDALVLRMAQGAEPQISSLNCGQLILCTPGTYGAEAPEVWLGGTGVNYVGNASFLGVVIGDHSATGNYADLQIHSGGLELQGNLQKAKLQRDCTLSLTGNCRDLTLSSRSKAYITGDCDTVSLGAYGELELRGHVRKLTMDSASVLTLHGTAEEIEVTGKNATLKGDGQAELVTIHEGGTSLSLQVTTLKDLFYENGYLKDYNSALDTVKTHRVPCTMQSTVTMYSNQNMTGSLGTVPAGARVYLEWNPSGDGIRVSHTDGDGKTRTGWVARWAVSIHSSQAIYDGSLDYSQGTKEGFVDLRGYDSETEYLIWVSRYTQKVMVYQGSKGDWNLIKTMPCATGANYCPTPQGVYKLEGHRTIWDFGDYVVYNVTVYNGPFAFHTVLYYPGGKLMDGTIGQPKSQGCVRMTMEDSDYIYNLPLGTRVVIY